MGCDAQLAFRENCPKVKCSGVFFEAMSGRFVQEIFYVREFFFAGNVRGDCLGWGSGHAGLQVSTYSYCDLNHQC